MNRTKYISTARSSTENSSGQTSSISFKSNDYEHCLELRYTVHYPFICGRLPKDSQNGFLCVMSLCEHQGNHVPCIVWASGQLCVLYCVSIRAVMYHVLCEHQGICVLCIMWASGQSCAVHCLSIIAAVCCTPCEHHGSHVLFTVWVSGQLHIMNCVRIRAAVFCALCEHQSSCVPYTVYTSRQLKYKSWFVAKKKIFSFNK